MITTPPTPSRFHVFTNLTRAICTCVSYMWGSFRHILTLARGHSPTLEHAAPSMPQDTIRGQLNKGWVPLSEHLPQDYDEVLMRDHLHCLETTIAHTLTMHSKLLPNCIPLLQEVETDIHMRVQLTSAQSDAAAWYTVLGTYAVLTSHINNLTSCPACRGLFPETTNTSTPQPLPPPPPTPPHPPNTSLSTTHSIPTAAPPLPSPIPPSSPPISTLPPLPLTLPPPPPPPTSPPPPLPTPPLPPPLTSPPPPTPPHTVPFNNRDPQFTMAFAPHPPPLSNTQPPRLLPPTPTHLLPPTSSNSLAHQHFPLPH